MRTLVALLWMVLGVGLAAAVQWAAQGAPALAAALPGWAPPLLLPLALLLFGVFLAAGYGDPVGAARGILGGIAALLLAGIPLAYAYGVAQRYGLPAQLPLGGLLAGGYARAAATVWLPLAVRATVRGARSTPRRPARVWSDQPPVEATAWTPIPAATEGGPVAYTPAEPDRG